MLSRAAAGYLGMVGLDGPWTYPALAGRFEAVLGPDGVSLAARVLALSPREPFDAGVLARLLAALPDLPAPAEVPLSPGPAPGPALRFGVPPLADLAGLAALLRLTPGELDWFADRGHWLRHARDPLRHYRCRPVGKRVGVRLLEVPKPRLRELQRTVLRRVLDPVPPHEAAHGFRRGRGVHSFAAPHAGADVVVHLDLRHFFPTVGAARVRAVFLALGYPRAVADALTGLCTTITPVAVLRALRDDLAPGHGALLRGAHLPEGAATSPALANLVARRLDVRLAGAAVAHDVRYTRYADDLAFSGSSGTDVTGLLRLVGLVVAEEGFAVHPDKTRVRRAHRSQRLAGLVVNAAPAVPRAEVDALRALLHNAARTGAAAQDRQGHPDFHAHVLGRISWVGAGHPQRRTRLLAMADLVDWDA